LCGDLKSGDRLLSTHDLARRSALHPNTTAKTTAKAKTEAGPPPAAKDDN
jgi:DNA-binding transcriptional regulator YhcF (GntR family)